MMLTIIHLLPLKENPLAFLVRQVDNNEPPQLLFAWESLYTSSVSEGQLCQV